jgi:20S proteasome subunit alpha 7
MSATGSGYDYSPTTFSPDGRVFQVEYAVKAVEQSGTVLGVRCVDGVVLGVEKTIISKMLVAGSNRRLFTVNPNTGMATAGMPPDARQLVNFARAESASYKGFFGHDISGKILAERTAGHVHTHTLYWYLRPYGAQVMIANFDDESGPQLHMIEPAGTVYKYFACSVGKGKQGAKTELEKLKFDTITCREAVDKIAEIIYKLHDDVKDKDFELELSWVCNESNRKHVMVPADLKAEAIKKAVAAKEKADMEDSDDEATPKPPTVVHTPTDDTPPTIEEASDEEPPMV